jgi:hypothetical protein
MSCSGMLHRVALVRTDVSRDRIASIIRVTRNDELGTTLAVTSNRSRLRRYTTAGAITELLSANDILYFVHLFFLQPLRKSYLTLPLAIITRHDTCCDVGVATCHHIDAV